MTAKRSNDSLPNSKTNSGSSLGTDRKLDKFKTREYRSWESMRQRCNNPKNAHYKDYGGRGIEVCERWNSFDKFLEDMGPRPEGTSLDRINNDGHYEPSNVRWADMLTQQRNKRDIRMICYMGSERPLTEWAEILGVEQSTLWSRLKQGWLAEEILFGKQLKLHKRILSRIEKEQDYQQSPTLKERCRAARKNKGAKICEGIKLKNSRGSYVARMVRSWADR